MDILHQELTQNIGGIHRLCFLASMKPMSSIPNIANHNFRLATARNANQWYKIYKIQIRRMAITTVICNFDPNT